MVTKSSIDDQTNYYIDNICDNADHAYQLCLLLTFNKEQAKKCLDETYELITDRIEAVYTKNDACFSIVQNCWEAFNSLDHQDADESNHLANIFSVLTPTERTLLYVVDFWNLTYPLTSNAIGISSLDGLKALAKARKHVATFTK